MESLPDKASLDLERHQKVDGPSVANGSCMLWNKINEPFIPCTFEKHL